MTLTSLSWYYCDFCTTKFFVNFCFEWSERNKSPFNANHCPGCGSEAIGRDDPDSPSDDILDRKTPVFSYGNIKDGIKIRSFIPETNEEIGIVTTSYEDIFKIIQGREK